MIEVGRKQTFAMFAFGQKRSFARSRLDCCCLTSEISGALARVRVERTITPCDCFAVSALGVDRPFVDRPSNGDSHAAFLGDRNQFWSVERAHGDFLVDSRKKMRGVTG